MKDLNSFQTPAGTISEPSQEENIVSAPKCKPYCIQCGETTLWADNQRKLLKYIDTGTLTEEWPSDIPISAIPPHNGGNRPGGIVCVHSFQFIKGSKLLKKLRLGKMYQVQVNGYICHTCGADWVTETQNEI